MKRTILNLVLLAMVSFAFGQSHALKNIPLVENGIWGEATTVRGDAIDNNTNFEHWNAEYASMFGEMPVGWFMLTGNKEAQKSTNAASGNYSMHVESNVMSMPMMGWYDTLIGGVSVIGHVEGMSIVEGEPYTKRPVFVSLYAQGNLMNNDTSIVLVRLSKDNTVVAEALGLFGANDLSNTWTQKKLTFEYVNDMTPNVIEMLVSSTGVGVLKGINIGTLTAGSYIEIDKLSLEGNLSLEEDNKWIAAVYPNPATDVIVIDNANQSTVSIINMMGQVVVSQYINSEHANMDISQLPEGTYIVRMEKGSEINTQKLNIVR